MERIERGRIAMLAAGALTSCSDPSLLSPDASDTGGNGEASVDVGTSDTAVDGGTTDAVAPAGKWTTASTSGTTPVGAGDVLAIGLTTKLVILHDDGLGGMKSATFDGSTWSAVAVPTGLKGTACAGAVAFAGGALVYSGCASSTPDINQTWAFDGSSWNAKASGGQGRAYGAMARANDPSKVFMTGGTKLATSKLDWLASWTPSGGWQTEPDPATLLGTKGFPDDTFTIFNLGDAAYAIDSTGKMRKWDGADWTAVAGASPAPTPPSLSWTQRSVATDGKRTLLQLGPKTYSWDGKNWTLISEDPACEGGRTPRAVANVASRFFLFCLPSAGATTPWQIREWK